VDADAGVVVGAAIERDGRLLAARRSGPPAMAGGWEFPGGKVEPGETEAAALVRECQEELGVTVRLGRRVGPDTPLPNDRVLRVWLAGIVDEGAAPAEPHPLQDHDVLRWLEPEELSSVAWLPADWPIVHALAECYLDEVPLPGGRVGGVVRVGDTVRRPTGPWTPAVHALVEHVSSAGVMSVPDLLGFDPGGREVYRFVPGTTVGDAPTTPAAFRSSRLVGQVGAWLRTMHEASATFPTEHRQWRRGLLPRRPGSVICHNDISPHNVVLDADGSLAAVLDWDMAAPGDPRDDLAFAAWQFVLRQSLSPADEARGLRALATGYGGELGDPVRVLDRVAPRLRGAVRFMRRGAAAGDQGLQRLLTSGIPEATEAGVEAVLARRDDLARLVRLG
jgi:mutator protein MutT